MVARTNFVSHGGTARPKTICLPPRRGTNKIKLPALSLLSKQTKYTRQERLADCSTTKMNTISVTFAKNIKFTIIRCISRWRCDRHYEEVV